MKPERVKPEPSFAPVYAAIYPDLAKIARVHGYALAVHGSMQRDFDVVAIPWTENPSKPLDVVKAFQERFAIDLARDGVGIVKNHGRVCYTLYIGFGECFVDLSFMPVIRGVEKSV